MKTTAMTVGFGAKWMAAGALLVLAGCAAGGQPWGSPRHIAMVQDSRGSDRDVDRRSGSRDDDERSRDHYDGIPGRARVGAEGVGKIKYKAPSAGRIYVGDDELERQIVSVKVKRGDTIEVDADKDRVKKNDEVVFDRNLERRNAHTIYFLRDAGADEPDDGDDFGGGYDGIPTSAKRAKSGGGVVRYQVTKEGRVWVGDDDREKMVLARAVVKGDIVEVDPAKDQVRLNGEVISDKNLERRNEHSVFFRAEKSPGGGSGGGGGGGSEPPKDPKPPKPEKPEKPSTGGSNGGGTGGGITGGSGHPAQLKGASRVAKGAGVLSYVATADGDVWVYDAKEKKIVAAGAIKKGETLRADPANNTTTLPAGARNFENYIPSHEHEVYFRKS